MQKPVVCHLVERLSYGGAEMLVHRFARGMRTGGYEPLVCCLQDGPLRPLIEADGIRVECLGLPRRSILDGPAFAAFGVTVLARLVRLFRRRQVSLVHAHLPDSIIWAALAGTLSGTPVIGTYHGLAILPAGRHAFDPRNRLRALMYRIAERLSDRTIAVSGPVRDLLCREMGFTAQKTVLLVNGIDTAAFGGARDDTLVRAELGLEGRRVITCIGRLVDNKGQQYLIEAMRDVVQSHPAAALLLVGDGPALEPLRALAQRLQIADTVRFAGSRTDVPEILALTEVFVLPSFYEGIPLALVEAMAANRPVIATSVPGNLDVIGDDGCGLLVPPKDAAALAGAIAGLLDDPPRARAMAARGRARARRDFDLRRALAAMEALYDDVLAGRARRPARAAV